MLEVWTPSDSIRANDEGWNLFESDERGLEIERDDEAGIFDSDERAVWHVMNWAAEGSQLHQKALACVATPRAKKYRVHVYMTVRVAFDGIEADSQIAALDVARKMAGEQCMTLRDVADLEGEMADEVTGFLVDEDGDAEFLNSTTYDGNGKPAPEYAESHGA